MKRSPIRSRARTKHQLANVEHEERRAWTAAQPCIACCRPGPSQVAHVGVGGMGLRHGTDLDIVPLCSPGCHEDQEQTKGKFARPEGRSKSDHRFALRSLFDHWIAVHRGRFEARDVGTFEEVPF